MKTDIKHIAGEGLNQTDQKTRAKCALGTGRFIHRQFLPPLSVPRRSHGPAAGDCQGASCSQAPPQPQVVIPWGSSPAIENFEAPTR